MHTSPAYLLTETYFHVRTRRVLLRPNARPNSTSRAYIWLSDDVTPRIAESRLLVDHIHHTNEHPLAQTSKWTLPMCRTWEYRCTMSNMSTSHDNDRRTWMSQMCQLCSLPPIIIDHGRGGTLTSHTREASFTHAAHFIRMKDNVVRNIGGRGGKEKQSLYTHSAIHPMLLSWSVEFVCVRTSSTEDPAHLSREIYCRKLTLELSIRSETQLLITSWRERIIWKISTYTMMFFMLKLIIGTLSLLKSITVYLIDYRLIGNLHIYIFDASVSLMDPHGSSLDTNRL